VREFYFRGTIPASKSLMNRALIVQSYDPRLKLSGDSSCDDVVHLRKSLARLESSARVFDCGEGGTTLRFLAFRVSRKPGTYLLKGSARLLKRPQDEVQNILGQLGVEVRFEKSGLRILSRGWKNPARPVVTNARESSQFLSALVLNSWNLDFDLKIKVQGKITSESYFSMTLKLLKELGLRYRRQGSFLTVPAGQKVKVTKKYQVESDLSSLFSVASFAAVSGKAQFLDFPGNSLQPDAAFVSIFKKMGIACSRRRGSLGISSPQKLKAVQVSLRNSPDLFPVLAAVCTFAEGRSVLYGAPQLVLKESNRIEKTAELLRKCGVQCRTRKDGLEIQGRGLGCGGPAFVYDPDQDHRLAMAAGLLKYFGQNIRIKHPKVVRKSFPEFWSYVGVRA